MGSTIGPEGNLLDPRPECGHRDAERREYPGRHPVTGVDHPEQQVAGVYPVVAEVVGVRLGGHERRPGAIGVVAREPASGSHGRSAGSGRPAAQGGRH